MAAVLASSDRHTMEDMRALHADVRSQPAVELRPHLLAVEPASDQERRALEAVAAWDLELTVDSPGATVYEAWYWKLWENVLADELGEELTTFYMSRAISQVPVMLDLLSREDAPWFDDTTTPEVVETRDDVVRRTFAEAVAWLSEHYGEDPAGWAWGRAHTVTFAHVPLGQSGIGLLERIFNSRTLPLAGDVFTVNSSMHDLADPFAVNFGVAQRLLVDLGDLDRSLAVNSTGQVAHAFHPHREDQIALWAAVDYHPLPATREAATAEAEATLRLTPP
jgi:penicillin amidase